MKFLCWLGVIARRRDGTIHWPISIEPWHMWKVQWVSFKRGEWFNAPFAPFGLFRNLPGVIKWIPGRVLPRRWGFFVFGIEVGDRGCLP